MSLHSQRFMERHRRPPAGPLIPIFATLAASLGVGAGGAIAITGAAAGFTAGAWAAGTALSYVAVGAGLLGINYAMSANAPSAPVQRDRVNSPEQRGAFRQAAVPKQVCYGIVKKAGPTFYLDDDTPPYQVMGFLLNSRPINRIISNTINNNLFGAVGGFRFNEILEPVAIDGQDYAGNLLMSFQNGRPGQGVDPLLLMHEPDLDPRFIQEGFATCTQRATFGTTDDEFRARWGSVQFVTPEVEFESSLIYDPRVPSCRMPRNMDDRDEVAECMNTWVFRREAALIQSDILIQSYGGQWRTDRIRLDELARCADRDGELVQCRDGSLEMRHPIDGVIMLDQNPRTIVDAMLTANAAFMVDSKGRVGWTPNKKLKPVMTLTERDLVGALKFRRGQPQKSKFNTVRQRFAPRVRGYREDDGPPYVDEEALANDNELLDTTIRAPFTTSAATVQRLAKLFLKQSRLGDTAEIRVRWNRLGLRAGQVIRLQHRHLSYVDGLYQIKSVGIDFREGTMVLALAQYDPTLADDWDPMTDEKPFESTAQLAA